ncbi:uncharacterized protein LOC131955769 isoform X1 [Physella acuta]|uniref:uncharacterized protein LOC131955769 isoform X1 n=1 Tax=Physella acuta TaxID=109671 RepID=UPI0027DC8EEF|nr:uncharacterized protein LOC131955769 isoform X1 [Physella acuta]XP_059176007.1 uncharacterized protein LOC131955769 isoform X1 [Physella acuta]
MSLLWNLFFACTLLGTVNSQRANQYTNPLKMTDPNLYIYNYLNYLDNKLSSVEARGCDAGLLNITVCFDMGDPLAYNECNVKVVNTTKTEVYNVPVLFRAVFRDVPVVTSGLNGNNFVLGTNVQVEPTDVTTSGFNIRVTLSGYLPFDVRLFWFACSPAQRKSF